MILKKPYAFFIKMFKPIHLVLSILLMYLIYLENLMLNFYAEYIYSETTKITGTIDNLYNNNLYIIPIITIVAFLVIFGIMFQKKKPYLFYLIYAMAFIGIIVINVYSLNFLHTMEEQVVAVKSVKLIHDFSFLTIAIEGTCLIVLLIRGIGINIRKFDFNSDLSKIDISEKDREEFEVNVNLNLDATRKNRRAKLRKLKYFYFENKFIVNILFGIIFGIILLITGIIVYKNVNYNREGKEYLIDNFNITVNKSIITNSNSTGDIITKNYLLVVDLKLKSLYSNKKLYLKDFTLDVEGAKFKPTDKYYNSFLDIGIAYTGDSLSTNYNSYIIIYEISEKYIDSVMNLIYISESNSLDIRLNPQEIIDEDKIVSQKRPFDEMVIKENFGEVNFTISEIYYRKEFLINYNYCISENDCIPSKEHLKPSMDTNFDKTVLKLKVDYEDKSNINLISFYKLLSMFGSIYYKKGDTWNVQSELFEEIKSNKMNDGYIYIGINSEIIDSNSVKFVFNIRGSKYEYVLW